MATVSRRARRLLATGASLRVDWLVDFLHIFLLRIIVRRRISELHERSVCSATRRRSPPVRVVRPIHRRSRRNILTTCRTRNAGNLFRVSPAIAGRHVLHVLFLSAILPNRNVHGGRTRAGTSAAYGRKRQ